jgi:hypothetical protein
MRRLVTLAVILLASAMPLFAVYIVVLKDGTRYRAREHWTLVNGKANITTESGQVLQLDASLIDVAKTNDSNSALGDSRVLAVGSASPTASAEQSTLGSVAKIRRIPSPVATVAIAPAHPAVPAGPVLGNNVTSKFGKAYENVELFDATITSPEPAKLHVELTADNEDKVFNAMTATAYMMIHVPQSTGSRIDLVELFMKTINGGSAGRFQITQDDARALDSKAITPQMFFIQKVIY